MKETQLSFSNKNKIKSINSNLKQIPIKFKHNLIALKSLPEIVLGSKSFRQQSHYFTTKNSTEKIKKVKIIENQSFEQKSQSKPNFNSKNKNAIINNKNKIIYNKLQGNSNFLNYKIDSSNNINNNNAINANLFNTQKLEKESDYLRINTVMNELNPYFCQSINNNIYNKNKKNSNKNQNYKLMSCLTGFVKGYKGIFKGYNTTNNTANNSISESIEKINNNNKKEMKTGKSIIKKNMIKSIKPTYIKNLENQKKK